jgi:hypothetical protein
MKFLLCLVASLPFALACQVPEDPAPTVTPELSTPTATSTPSPPATSTPTCNPQVSEEKCELLRTFTPLPTATMPPPPLRLPAGTRSGVDDVDAIIAAIETKDATRLAGLISLTTVPCVAQSNRQPEPFLCRDGVAPGTPKTGVWVTHVEGGLTETTENAFAERVLATAAERSWKLHSVYSYALAGRQTEWMPETDYFITFVVDDPGLSWPECDNLRVVNGRIVGLHFAFGEPYPCWETPPDPGWLLPRAQ